jgi:murein DD-endopeptidase
MKKLSFTIFIVTALLAKFSFALDLGMPLSCVYGEDCLIESYFDHDAKKGEFLDHTCGKLSSDKHASTDFMLMNTAQSKDGVNVLAGDSGVVKQVRDGMGDVRADMVGEEAIRGRECGNGLVIEHKRGYETQYCHLKQNSIVVKKGDKVEKGQIIAKVGMSGLAYFPILEFTVSNNGKAVDPFTGEDSNTGESTIACDNPDIYPLWDRGTEKKLKYITTSMLSAGFAGKVPHVQGARDGKFNDKTISEDAKTLSFWVDVFGVLKDDELKLTVLKPDGSILSTESRKFTNSNRRVFQFLGKKRDEELWPAGEYTGKLELTRKDGDETDKVINSAITVEVVKADAVKESENIKDKTQKVPPEASHN